MNSTHEDKSSALIENIDMPSDEEQDKSLNTSIGKEVDAVLEESEEKRMLSKKEREIVILKRKLQEKEVYGSTTEVRNELKNMSENSDEKIGAIELKLNDVIAFIEEQKKNSIPRKIESLHNKIDKMIRLLSDVTETQKKNSKVLQHLQKAHEAQAQKEQDEIEKLKKTRYSASLPSNLAAVASKDPGCKSPKPEDVKLKSAIFSEKNSKDGATENNSISKSPIKPPLPPDPHEELRWGENMILVGDTFWRSFLRLEDVKNTVDKMEQAVQFRIPAARDNEVIKRLYDSARGKILFALPPKVKIVGISIGATDILEAKPEHIKTLKEGPLNEVKRHNLPSLQYMAQNVKAMIEKLLSMNKFVLLLIPLYGSSRREVFDQWQTVLTEVMSDLPFPSFRILNLQNLMKSTLPQFASSEQMFETWLSDRDKLCLSAYGTRRLFDALKKAMWCSNKKLLENGAYLKNTIPSHIQHRCPRCIRFHAGGADTCKSKNMICNVCGKLGHFTEVHEVQDTGFRAAIIKALGEDIEFSTHTDDMDVDKQPDSNEQALGLDTPANNCNVNYDYTQNALQFEGPLTKKQMLERNSAQALLPWH